MKNIFKEFNYDDETLEYLLNKLEEYDYGEPFVMLAVIHQRKLTDTPEEAREKTLNLLLPLLKNNELVMLVRGYKKENGKLKQVFSKISSPKTAEEDIEILREEWNKFPEVAETVTWFVLPKNKHILEEFIKPKERKEEKNLKD